MKSTNKRTSIFGAAVFSLAVTANAHADYTLTILHTNDLNGHILPVSENSEPCVTPDEKCVGGVARLKTKLDERKFALERVKRPVVSLFAGDFNGQTPIANAYQGQAAVELFNLLDFDALALGDEDFKLDAAAMSNFLNRADFPVLAGNASTHYEPVLADKIPGYTVLKKGGQKIAVVSVVTKDAKENLSEGSGVDFSNEIQYLQTVVADIQAQGINKIIALTHVGHAQDIALAEAVPGIDIIVGGHSKTMLSNSAPDADGPYPVEALNPLGRDVVIVNTGGDSKFLGELRVTFDDDGYIKFTSGNPHYLGNSTTPYPAVETRIGFLAARIEDQLKKQTSEPVIELASNDGTTSTGNRKIPFLPVSKSGEQRPRPDNKLESDVKDGAIKLAADPEKAKFVVAARIVPTQRPEFPVEDPRVALLDPPAKDDLPIVEIADAPGEYTVKQDDTLWIIARKVYGDPTLWERIRDANGVDQIRTMKLGSTLKIPQIPGTKTAKKADVKQVAVLKPKALAGTVNMRVEVKPAETVKPSDKEATAVTKQTEEKADTEAVKPETARAPVVKETAPATQPKTEQAAAPAKVAEPAKVVEPDKPSGLANLKVKTNEKPEQPAVKPDVETSVEKPKTETTKAVTLQKEEAEAAKAPLPTPNPEAVKAPLPVPNPKTGKSREYTVQQDDTLWIIAGKVYNDPTQWKRIQDANGGGKIRDMKVGSILVIPN